MRESLRAKLLETTPVVAWTAGIGRGELVAPGR